MPSGPPASWADGLLRQVRRHRPGLDLLVLVVGAVAFYLHCLEYEVVQDDAYISFVYSKNLTLGNGLVFNLGERVEGYTNFLWTMLHAVPHLVDIDVVATAQVLGSISALGLLAATWRLSRQLRPHRPAWAQTPAVILLAANGALAFWALSGMETLLFALLVTLGATSYVGELREDRPHWRTGLYLGLAALTRPEGILFFGLTVLHRLAGQVVARHVDLRTHLPSLLPFLALVAPHIIFRLVYYGYPLPNTFYAKTGMGMEYLNDGLQYTWKFLVDYGFWGLGLVAPIGLMVWRRQRAVHAYLAMLIGANALYVTAAGGDTMAENRLFLPVLALVYVELQEAGYRLVHLLRHGLRQRHRLDGGVESTTAAWLPAVGAAAVFALAAYYTFAHARPQLLHARLATEAHNGKLFDLADYIRTFPEPGELLIASTAIGIPRYFTEASVLDLVGLTDAVVAHDPVPLPGIRSNHRLRNYNVQYVMDRAPDLIYFITGEKPATPAEKALFMSRRFRQGYYMTYIADERPVYALRSDQEVGEEDEKGEDIFSSGAFVELYTEALDRSGDEAALALFERCLERAPADFAAPLTWMGRELYDRQRLAESAPYFLQAVARDDHQVMALAHLSLVSEFVGRAKEAVVLSQRAVELAPRSHFSQYALGRALLAAGHTDPGLAALLRALDLDGLRWSAVDAHYRIGLASFARGDYVTARQGWANALRLNPDHPSALEGIRALDRAGH